MAMMSNEGEKKCPLCAEEMDWTDQQLKPCNCGYEICVWCWHHIMDMAEKDGTEGRCPACRAPYDKEKIVGTKAKCERLVAVEDREIKPHKPKPKKQEEKKDLSNVRVIQRKMAYVIGLPLSLADEDLLQRKEYFGQYGKICKVSLSRTAGGTVQQFVNDTCSVYITYSKEEEAIRCIQSVHGFILDDRPLRASFGTAKYCHAWLKNMPCNNQACLYLHTLGADEDSFGKDEEAAVHTRNRVHQIVGATHNMEQRSGSILPPPVVEPLNSSSIASDKSMKKELTSNGPLTCSISSKDQHGCIKTPSRSFVDVVARSSSGPELGNATEDQKLSSVCSDFYSLSIKVPSLCPLPVAADSDSSLSTASSFREHECYHLPLPDKESQSYAINSFRDSSKLSASSRADHTKEQCFSISDSSHSNLEEDLLHHDDHTKDNHASQVSYSSSANGIAEVEICRHVNPDRSSRSSNSFMDEEIVEKLRNLDGHNTTANSDHFALDAVESNIVSSILSLDFDSCDDSLSLPHSLARLYGVSDGSVGKSSKSEGSRFSFAKEEEASDINSSFSYNDQSSKTYSLFSDYVGQDPVEKQNPFSSGPRNNGFQTQSSAPPGFSVTPRDPTPGSSLLERTSQLYPASSGSYVADPVYYPNNQNYALSHGHTRNVSDLHFNDPAILAVHRGNSAKEMNNLGLNSYQTSNTPQLNAYNDEARLWLLMQQTGATQPLVHQEFNYPLSNGDNFSDMGNNNFGVNSKVTMNQNQIYNPSYSQYLQYGNGLVANGYWPSGNEMRQNGELGVQEIPRNDRVGFDKYLSGNRDLMYQMPSSGDVYNRV